MAEPEAITARSRPISRCFAPTAAICWRSMRFSRRCMPNSRETGAGDWRRWPVDLRDPASATVAVFAASRRRRGTVPRIPAMAGRSVARRRRKTARPGVGMRIGLIGDLAVGMDPTGSHAWSRQGDILGGLSIGAPPDLFNPRGQDWGLTGFSPRALINGGFAPFLATVRAALRHTGGVRIDHAMGLARLWLIPRGRHRRRMAPISPIRLPICCGCWPWNRSVIRRSSSVKTSARCRDGFRETLEAAGVHGMRVMWFEREGQAFARSGSWDHAAIAMTSTHDLPTVAGWWHGTRYRDARGMRSARQWRAARPTRWANENADRAALWAAFSREGVAAGEPRRQPVDTRRRRWMPRLRFVARTSVAALPAADRGRARPGGAAEPARHDRTNIRTGGGGCRARPVRSWTTPDVAARVAHLAAKRPRL